eukprot:CAMPEP_0179106150 /NCGR_PEP_ID=MMETSP0796-20121207/49334_1 /TAXON_ID=73915 /ORGANISM="Pyrodinium bahamense, Strain pbaha01" /LENGTH=216 /DNA_ID=CAMNT_0020804157 /DNA_START=345 /DNA_END=993 /DNA_ORIENTATION=+
MLPAVLELPVVPTAIRPIKDAFPALLVVLKLPLVLAAVREGILPLAVHLAVLPLAFIGPAGAHREEPLLLLVEVVPIAVEGEGTGAVLHAAGPLALVHRAVLARARAFAVCVVVGPRARVNVAVAVFEGPAALGLASAELTPVLAAVGEDLVALTVWHVVKPLACVLRAIGEGVDDLHSRWPTVSVLATSSTGIHLSFWHMQRAKHTNIAAGGQVW